MSSSLKKFFSEPLDVQWRTAVLRLPRMVPDQVLRITSYEGPHPFVLKLPSRGTYSIPVYVFVPSTEPPPDGYPVILDFHGGGFVMGSCLEQAPFCAKMARELNTIVITVDYRMGPIDKFPAAVEDGEDVLSAILDPDMLGFAVLRAGIATNVKPAGRPVPIDITRLALTGFSSGGNLALNLALSLDPPQVDTPWPSRIPTDHPRRIPVLLYYPSFDARQLPSERTLPPKMPASKTFWRESFDILHQTYLPRELAAHPRASPGLADIRALHNKARVYLVLPEMDSLAEQSEAWVEKVKAEGREKDLKVTRVKGMRHGWTQMPVSWLNDEERRTRDETFRTAVRFVKDAWDGPEVDAAAMGNTSTAA